jgi:hypothetical protein
MCVREVDLVCLCLCPPARAAKDRTFSQRCQPYVYRQREPLIRHETERGRREIKSTSSYRDSSIVLDVYIVERLELSFSRGRTPYYSLFPFTCLSQV